MRFLYIFPHPDDESFGPAAAMWRQLQHGHEVHLLTLTKGEATSVREKLGVTKSEMADIRYREMLDVADTLGLTSMEVLELPDSRLARMDPREIEAVVKAYIQKLRPDIVVTYPVHGNSAFHDHLVTHAVVKRVYLELLDEGADYLKRLAFITRRDDGSPTFQNGRIRLKLTEQEQIHAELDLTDAEINAMKRALECYQTYQGKIEESGVLDKIGYKLPVEFYNESPRGLLANIEEGL